MQIQRGGAIDNGAGHVTLTAPSGAFSEKATFAYDAMGRLTRQQDWTGNGTGVAYDRQLSYNAKGQVHYETTAQKQGNDTFTSTVTTHYGSGAGYALGAATQVATTNAKNGVYQPSTSTVNSYAWYEGAVQASVAYKPDTGQSTTWTTTYDYSASGVLQSAYVGDGRPRSIAVTNDVLGQAIRRDEADGNTAAGDPHAIWYRFDGRELGHVTNNGGMATSYQSSIDQRTRAAPTATGGAFRGGSVYGASEGAFGDGYTPFTSYAQGSGGGAYIVQAGDTLAGIAAGLWGDASLWYKLAEANGLSGASALADGMALTIPAGVGKSGNSASTFKPYDPADALGDTSPTTPRPQAAKKKGCGAFGAILLVVVAVAVTIASHGTLTGALGPVLGTAAAGAAGSVASQAFGLATGIQQGGFDFKAVGMAALSAVVGGGGTGSFITDVANGALSNALVQGIGVATGLQSKFDWAGVAAAGIGAGVGGQVKAAFGRNSEPISRLAGHGQRLATSGASSIAYAASRSLIEGTSFGDNIMASLPSVIGQTLGGGLVDWIGGAFAGASRTGKAGAMPGAGDDGGAMGEDLNADLMPGGWSSNVASIDLPSTLAGSVYMTAAWPEMAQDAVTLSGPAVPGVVYSVMNEDGDWVVTGKRQRESYSFAPVDQSPLFGLTLAQQHGWNTPGWMRSLQPDPSPTYLTAPTHSPDGLTFQQRAELVFMPTTGPVAAIAQGVTRLTGGSPQAQYQAAQMGMAGDAIVAGIAMRGRNAPTAMGRVRPLAGAPRAAESGAGSVWHATATPGAARSILENGINPKFLSAESRFGKGFYVAEQPGTALAELAHHGVAPTTGIRFSVNQDALRVLDLTDASVARAWGYKGGPISSHTQALGTSAANQGYNAIRFTSERAAGNNLVVIRDFNDVLRPVMVTPTRP